MFFDLDRPDSTALRRAARERIPAPSAITGVIVDSDIDGLLSGALLHHLFGWPIIGMYDTSTLWLAGYKSVPLDLDRTLWVDVDITWPGCTSISQHVLSDTRDTLERMPFFKTTVNPNVFFGVTQNYRYSEKYPFGTFQWLWWVLQEDLERRGLSARLDGAEGRGLAWIADGGYLSVVDYQDNCGEWATRRLPGLLLGNSYPLPSLGTPVSYVRVAKRWLIDVGGAPSEGWAGVRPPAWDDRDDLPLELGPTCSYDLQWSSRDRRRGPNSDFPPVPAAHVLNAITSFYGWGEVTLPRRFKAYRGIPSASKNADVSVSSEGWMSVDGESPIASAAATGFKLFRWTTAGNGDKSLRAALGEPKPVANES